MHILVDIRTTSPADLIRQSYGLSWAKLWKTYHPHDMITFLVIDGTIIDEPSISVPRKWGIFSKKKIAHHQNGPDRVVSFSRCEPIDTHIPTLTHVFDNTDILYPQEYVSYLGRKKMERNYQRYLKKSHDIIVPHVEVGMELVEIYDIPESKISVIPYHIGEREHHPFQDLHPYGISLGYWIVEGRGSDEWNPFQLLQAYSRYIHEENGTKRLIIAGDLGANLSHISECIRGLNIMEYVKIVGVLPSRDHATLYEYASGWISLGGYYSSGVHISLALTYGLPILASDIVPLRDYADILVHPNHTDEFTAKLTLFSRLTSSTEKYIHSPHTIIDVYARVLSESTCK